MTFYPIAGSYYENLKDKVLWNVRYGSPVSILDDLYTGFLDRERGVDMPYYFPTATRVVKQGLQSEFESLANMVAVHESPLNKHRLNNWTYYKRLMYKTRNFYLYSNETMNNLFYYTQMSSSEYQKVKSNYNFLFGTNLLYNAVSGTALVAYINHQLARQNRGVFGALVGSLVVFGLLYANYEISDRVKNYFFNNTVRRLGYGQFIAGKTKSFPRNVELNL